MRELLMKISFQLTNWRNFLTIQVNIFIKKPTNLKEYHLYCHFIIIMNNLTHFFCQSRWLNTKWRSRRNSPFAYRLSFKTLLDSRLNFLYNNRLNMLQFKAHFKENSEYQDSYLRCCYKPSLSNL